MVIGPEPALMGPVNVQDHDVGFPVDTSVITSGSGGYPEIVERVKYALGGEFGGGGTSGVY